MLNIHTELLEKHLTSPEFYVLCQIAKRTNGKKVCYPSRDLLKKETGLGRDALKKAIRGLIEKKIITSHQERPEGGNFGKTIYTLLSDKIANYKGKEQNNRSTGFCHTECEKGGRSTGFRSTVDRSTGNDPLNINNFKELITLNKELNKKVKILEAQLAKTSRGKKLLEVAEFPPEISEKLKGIIIEFFQYRIEIKKPYNSLISLNRRIKKFAKEKAQFGEPAVIGAIEKTITSSWIGVDVEKFASYTPHPQTLPLHEAYKAYLTDQYEKKVLSYQKDKVKGFIQAAKETSVQAQINAFKAQLNGQATPNLTDVFIFDVCWGFLSPKSGTQPDRRWLKLKKWFCTVLTDYQRNKADLRKLYKNWLLKTY